MILATTFNGESVRATFREWNAERDSLDAELSESLAALEAYQQHLDDWQRQLAAEREKLKSDREQFAQEQAAAQKSSSEASAEAIAELELSRARERELQAALDEQKRSLAQERSHWAEELKQVREVLERQKETPTVQEPAASMEWPVPAPPAQPASAAPIQSPTTNNGSRSTPRGASPVLGSIVEQFGKLRQQRAVERQSNNRQR
jgi:septal ring factor EnvC (AmiA/AmiB activator)